MAEKERALALRYRHVKFFDRRKAMRRLKTAQRLQKEAEASGAAPADGRSMDELTADCRTLEDDLLYVKVRCVYTRSRSSRISSSISSISSIA